MKTSYRGRPRTGHQVSSASNNSVEMCHKGGELRFLGGDCYNRSRGGAWFKGPVTRVTFLSDFTQGGDPWPGKEKSIQRDV